MGPGGAGFDAAGVLLRWASLRGRQVRPSVGGVKVSALRSTLFCACATAAFVAFPGAIVSLFSSDSSAVAMVSSALETNSALFAFFGIVNLNLPRFR